MTVPEPPPMLAASAEYAFGDTIGAADAAAVGHVVDAMRPRFGQPHVTRYAAPSTADFAQLRLYYGAKAAAGGWQVLPDVGKAMVAEEQAIGFSAGDRAFAVVWLAPRKDSPTTPVNVIRFGD